MVAKIQYPQLRDVEWLRSRHVDDRRTAIDIAAEIGCAAKSVRRALGNAGIEARDYRRGRLTDDDHQQWLDNGGVAGGRPTGPDEHKAAAAELGVHFKDLLVLGPIADPFYCGTDANVRDAAWFKALWDGYGDASHLQRRHIRRLHYRMISGGESMLMPDGRPYQNTELCFTRLCTAAAKARHLRYVKPLEFQDRRNPDPIIYAYAREEDLEDRTAELDSEVDWALPQISFANSLEDSYLSLPEPSVTGYDYEPADQPVLIEVWIEKTTMNDILEPLCRELGANLVPASGTQSITNAVKLLERCHEHGKPGHVVYISDFDPAGENMPRAVARQLEFNRECDFPDVDATLTALALTREQVVECALPRIPIKEGDARRVKFEDRNGEGAVELDALEALQPGLLERMVRDEVAPYQDPDLMDRLMSALVAAHAAALGTNGPRTPRKSALSWTNCAGRRPRRRSRSASRWPSCTSGSRRRCSRFASGWRSLKANSATCATTSRPGYPNGPRRPSRQT